MTAAIFFSLLGAFFLWVVYLNWRHRGQEKISIIEAAILKTTGQEPLPLTRFDKWLQTFQIIFAAIFGPLMLAVGISMLFDELGGKQ
jgi:uncharacterized membrane-anchored protein YitT (DUF2179 family)